MRRVESPPHLTEKERKPTGPGKLLIEYVSITGSLFLIVNAAKSVSWHEAATILTNPTGQAVCFVFGGVAVSLLWIVERFRHS